MSTESPKTFRDTGWVPFGRITRAHGVRGELRLVLHNPTDSLPEATTQVRLTPVAGAPRCMRLASVRSTRGALLVRFEGIEDREAARTIMGWEVAVAESDLPELAEGELYLYELIGAVLCDENGTRIGVVREILDNRGQDLVSIQTPGGDRLLPLEGSLLSWDRAARVVTMRIPPGLWD